MSTPISNPPAAGWYPDPDTPGQERWWSGIGWTDHTQQVPATIAKPDQAASGVQPIQLGTAERPVAVPRPAAAPATAPVRGRWGAGSIISIVLALVVFVIMAVWLSPWWLLLPVLVFVILWLVNDRSRLLRSVQARPADAAAHARILEHVTTAAGAMGVDVPDVFISPQPVRNAFALTDRKGGVVCVFQGTIDALADDEMAAVLAHEVGHIKNRDSLYLTFFESVRISLTVVFIAIALLVALAISMLTRGRGAALGGIFAGGFVLVGAAASFLLITAGQRSREYGADRLCAATQPDPLALGRALNRLQHSSEHWEVGDVPITVAARCIVPPFASSFISDIVASHPSTERRIARIEQLMGVERIAELEHRTSAEQWRLTAAGKRDALELARSARPMPIPSSAPLLALPDEALWFEGDAKRVSPKSVDGRQGFQVGENGRLFVTTERAVFVSPTGRVEWRWANLHDASWIGDVERGRLLVLAVEDRRRNSGVWIGSDVADGLQSFLDIALAERRGDRSMLVARLESEVAEHERLRPGGAH